jgi:hypothetical protein
VIDVLVEFGHDVTMFASGDSATRATLVPVWPRALRLGRPRSDPIAAAATLLETNRATRRIGFCCACAASGHVAAAPSSVVK